MKKDMGGFAMNNMVRISSAALLVWSLQLPLHAAPLSFSETFEAADGVVVGTIHGQNDWVLQSGLANVQSNVFASGSQALEIQNGRVSRELSGDGSSAWLHFQTRYTAAPVVNPSVVAENTILGFYVNTSRHLVIYSNTVPVELSAQIPLNTWVRFDLYCDFAERYWNLAMDGINVASRLPLYSTNNLLASMVFGNEDSASVYLDQVDIADTELTAGGLPDSDGDEIPDWWEQKYSGGVTNVVADSVSGNNGLTYLQTYIAGVSPTTSDPFTVSVVSGANGIRWSPTVPSRLYSVYWSTNLVDGFSLLQGDIPYPQSEYIDSAHAEEISGFYRLNTQVR